MFETSIKTALAGSASLSALVSTRIRPLHVAQKEARPYVAYVVNDREDPSPTHDGPSIFTRITYDVACVADTYEQCAQMSDLVRARLGALDGYVSGGVRVIWTRFQDETDIEQGMVPGAEKPLYMRSQTYRAMYRATE